eukprot:gene642-892_t
MAALREAIDAARAGPMKRPGSPTVPRTTFGDALMNERILVIGAGMAGLWTAMALARADRDITLLDRDPPPPEGGADAAFDDWQRRGARWAMPVSISARSTMRWRRSRVTATKATNDVVRQRPRYEAFLDRVPAFIAAAARTRQGPALRTALDSYDAARSLAASARGLSLDPQGTVFEMAGLGAGNAGNGSNSHRSRGRAVTVLPPLPVMPGGSVMHRECRPLTTVAVGAFRSYQPRMAEPYYITTAISYPNGRPHIGHAYEAVAADAIARFHRQAGRDVRFQTGTDEHGLKMMQTARDRGVETRALADEMSGYFKAMDDRLNISYDRFIRTVEPDHHAASVAIWEAMAAAGDLYLDRYEGWYSVCDEAFYDEKELVDGDGGAKLSPQGTPV